MNDHLTEDEFNQLLEIAHLALDERMFDEAQEMFALLSLGRPGNPHPRIGQALLQYAQQQPEDAIFQLEAVLRDFPSAVFTRSLLAKFLYELDRSGWQQHAQDVFGLCSSGVAFEMAEDLLQCAGEHSFRPANLLRGSGSCPMQ
jgi:hypothetical protein